MVYFACRAVGSRKLKNAQEFQTFALQTLYIVSYKEQNAETLPKLSHGLEKETK